MQRGPYSMNRRPLRILLAIIVALAQLSLLAAEKATQGILGEGKPWATAYFVQDSGKAGPTVLIVGGLHGDEPAGARAAAQIAGWSISRGKLIVIPRANELALRSRTRLTPTGADRNLNRDFPQAAGEEPKGDLARALWAFVAAARPAWLLDLHEGLEVRQQTPKSTGSSIIHDPNPATTAEASRMLDAINATVAEADRKFVLLNGPVRGGLACAAAELLGARAMILETTSHRQPLSLRTRQHSLMVRRFLADLDMLPENPDVRPQKSRQGMITDFPSRPSAATKLEIRNPKAEANPNAQIPTVKQLPEKSSRNSSKKTRIRACVIQIPQIRRRRDWGRSGKIYSQHGPFLLLTQPCGFLYSVFHLWNLWNL